MNKFTKISLAVLLLASSLSPAVSAETSDTKELPYMYKDPNWEKYTAGDKGNWPLPSVAPSSTGIYSLASNNSIDYKESKDAFFDTASKYKSSGATEIYYTSNPSTSINVDYPEGAVLVKNSLGETSLKYTFSETNVPAYNNAEYVNNLVIDTSQGQWLINNGYYSRDNKSSGITASPNKTGTAITANNLDPSPWEVTSGLITPEDFLMAVTKSIYGVQQSRPIYIQSQPFRLARKVTWYVTNPKKSDGSCGPITWTYKVGDWKVQDVSSKVMSWTNTSAPECGYGKTIDRGEYIVHPEGYLNNVYHTYNYDQNSYVSPNVYELYFTKLLKEGILEPANFFANSKPKTTDSFAPNPDAKDDDFILATSYATKYYNEYSNYGQPSKSGKLMYPTWAPELGALYTNTELQGVTFGHNITDKDVEIISSGNATLYERALGSRYKLTGTQHDGVTKINVDPYSSSIMTKDTVTVISALRLIEKALRVEEGDITKTEANIITKKYGAQYLDTLSSKDQDTVSFLIAKGIISFENYQEYANLYNPLTEGLAYKLIYRTANKNARQTFKEVSLTDTADLPSGLSEYRQLVLKPDLSKLSATGSLTSSGSLVKNNSGETLTLLSDVNFMYSAQKINPSTDGLVGTRYIIKANIDDPLKYLYRGMPLANTDSKGKVIINNSKVQVYSSSEKKLYNDVSVASKRYVGINSITYDSSTKRYVVEFYAYGDSVDTALKFVKANLQTRLSSVTTSVETPSVVAKDSGVVSSSKTTDISTVISSNNDLMVNKDFGLSAYSNSKTSIVGNSLMPGATAIKVEDAVMPSVNLLTKLTNTAQFESVGQKEIVSVDASQLKGLTAQVQTYRGDNIGKTTVSTHKLSSGVNTKGKNDITSDETFYNISMLKSADSLITDKTLKLKDAEGKQRELDAKIVISWELDLPSESEQESLVGFDVSPYINDNTKSSWIFTKPTNVSLRDTWEYNKGLSDALLKTVSGLNLSIPSGYFVPKVEILVDSLNSTLIGADDKQTNSDLTAAQLSTIEESFYKEVANNLSAAWVKTYIGSVALANYVSGNSYKDNKEISKYVDTKQTDSKGVYIKPSGKLEGVYVPKGKQVWSALVFNRPTTDKGSPTYFNIHSEKVSLDVYTIHQVSNGNKFYGYYFGASGEGLNPYLNIPYMIDNFGNLYKNMDGSGFSYDKSNLIMREKAMPYHHRSTGKVVGYKDHSWTVVEDNSDTIKLISNNYFNAVKKGSKIVQPSSDASESADILNVIHNFNVQQLGQVQENSINAAQFLRTESFDFMPSYDTIDVDTKFLAIKNGKLQPFIYKTMVKADGSTTLQLSDTTLNEGETVKVPSFVVLSKAVWSVTDTALHWSKKFIGANPELYNRGSIVQSLKEQLLTSTSKNLEPASEVKNGTLTIGEATGTVTEGKVTFTVPYTPLMVQGTSINETAVIDAFNKNADLVITSSGETASAAQYVEDKKVGTYDSTYKGYNNTLVQNGGRLQVATGTVITDYTSTSQIQSVSLTGIIKSTAKLLNNGATSSSNTYKVYQYQETKPKALIAPFTNGAPPVLSADNSIIAGVASNFDGLSQSLDIFDSLQKSLKKMAMQSIWHKVILGLIFFSLALSITTLLAYLFYTLPISNIFFTSVKRVTGVDLLFLMSVGSVNADGDPENRWIRTLKFSAILGLLPVVIYGLMVIYELL